MMYGLVKRTMRCTENWLNVWAQMIAIGVTSPAGGHSLDVYISQYLGTTVWKKLENDQGNPNSVF